MQRETLNSRPGPRGLFESAKLLVGSLVAHLHTRLALFSTEFAEEKLRLTTLLYSALMTIFLFFMTLVLAVFFVIAAYWDTPYRLHAIGVLALVFLVSAGIAGSKVRAQLQSRPRLFEVSLAELYKDRQQLESQ